MRMYARLNVYVSIQNASETIRIPRPGILERI